MIPFQTSVLRAICHSAVSWNQTVLFLEVNLDYGLTNPETFIATIELIMSLNRVFKHVPRSKNVFHVYSLGEAHHFLLSSFLNDVQQLSVALIAQSIGEYYLSILTVTYTPSSSNSISKKSSNDLPNLSLFPLTLFFSFNV